MGSTHPTGCYDEEALAALTQAYREIWKTVVLNDPFRDLDNDEKLRQQIIQAVHELATEGVFNVDELRDRTLEKVLFQSNGQKRRARRQSSRAA